MGKLPSNHRLAERKLIRLVHDGRWEIDADGRIWCVAISHGLKAGGSAVVPVKRRRAEKPLPEGYLMIRAMIDGKRVVGLAHRLVWQFLKGNIPDGLTVNHEDGVRNNNGPDNLTLATYSEQMLHSRRVLGHGDQRGEKNHSAKLLDSEVEGIRGAYAAGDVTMAQLGDAHGVSFQCISRLVRGTSRTSQGGPVDGADHRHAGERDLITGQFVGGRPSDRATE